MEWIRIRWVIVFAMQLVNIIAFILLFARVIIFWDYSLFRYLVCLFFLFISIVLAITSFYHIKEKNNG
jgi:hypothetical protein